MALIKHTYTYRRRNPKVIEGYKRIKHKDKSNTYDSRAGLVLMVKPLENLIKQLEDHLEKVEYWNTNNLQLESIIYMKHIFKMLETYTKMLESQNMFNEYSSQHLEQGYNE